MNIDDQMRTTLMAAIEAKDYYWNDKISLRENFDAFTISLMARKASNAQKPKCGPQSRHLSSRLSGTIQATLGKRYEVHGVDTFALKQIITDECNVRHTTLPVTDMVEGLQQGDVVHIECEYRVATNRVKLIKIKNVEKIA